MNKLILMQELQSDEGLKLFPYVDAVGKLTVGIGRNLSDVGISEDEARLLLANDVAKAAADLTRFLPWYSALDEVRQRVLLNMTFNLGVRGLLKFEQTLASIKRGDYEAAAQGMLSSVWARQVGRRATRLAAMMRTGACAT